MSPAPDADEVYYEARYRELLDGAVHALTAAANLRYPAGGSEGGTGVSDDEPGASPSTRQTDWGEFVALALLRTAANFGGITPILAGGSPDDFGVEAVQYLLDATSSFGSELWSHRTEPLDVVIYVDEILADDMHIERSQYEEAHREAQRQNAAAKASEPRIDYDHYLWRYERDAEGGWVSPSADAPPLTPALWRASPLPGGLETPDLTDAIEPSLDSMPVAYIAKSADAASELRRLEDERDARLEPFATLPERLEEQRLHEWAAYGEDLRAHIIESAQALDGLDVTIYTTVDVTTNRGPANLWTADLDTLTLENRLIHQAVLDTPTPHELPGSPLDRLADR